MAKLNYSVRLVEAPGSNQPVYVPVLVDHRPNVSLANVIESAIDRGLIAGLKPSAADSIATGVAEQIFHEFCQGHSVDFGQYFYGRPYLDGTVDGNGTLTEANKINVRLYKGDAFKLSLDDFNKSFEGADNLPKTDFIISLVNGATRGTIKLGRRVYVEGSMLSLSGDTVTVKFAEVGGTGDPVSVTEFLTECADQLVFNCPALDATKKYRFWVERVSEDGKTYTTKERPVSVLAADAPVVPAPTLTYCHSEEHTEESERNVVYEGYGLEFVGTNLTGATATATFQAGPEEDPTTLTVPANKLDIASQGLNAVIDSGWLADEILSSIDGGTAITFAFTTDGGTATLTAHKAE